MKVSEAGPLIGNENSEQVSVGAPVTGTEGTVKGHFVAEWTHGRIWGQGQCGQKQEGWGRSHDTDCPAVSYTSAQCPRALRGHLLSADN